MSNDQDHINSLQWKANTTRDNEFTKKITTDLSYTGNAPNHTLGVEQELKRFAMREYLKKRDNQILIGVDDNVVEDELIEDDLLLTNAVTENKVQDAIDKTRYLKETKSYITINSAARQLPPSLTSAFSNSDISGPTEPTLYSTGQIPVDSYTFYPFSNINGKDSIDFVRNQITQRNRSSFSLFDFTDPTSPVIIRAQQLATFMSDTFNVFFPVNPPNQPYGSTYSSEQLANELQYQANLLLSQQMGNSFNGVFMDPLGNPFYRITGQINPVVNQDLVEMTLSVPPNFKFIWYFIVSMVDINTAPPLSTFDSTENSQINELYFPYPNNYVIPIGTSYNNVKSLRIVSSEIPNTDTIINLTNNHISFSVKKDGEFLTMLNGQKKWDYYIAPGNYTVTELATEMEMQINNMIVGETNPSNSNVFTISANNIKGTFEIYVHSPYTFNWLFVVNKVIGWRNLYKMLGFRNPAPIDFSQQVTIFSNIVSVNTGNSFQLAPYAAFNLRNSSIIWMVLNQYGLIFDTFSGNQYFAKFTTDKSKPDSITYNAFTDTAFVFENAVLPSLTYVEVSFFDELGNPANFNNIDNSFTLEIVHHVDLLMGSYYSSQRGVGDKTSYI